MAKFMRHEVVGKMLEIGIIPVFYERDLETAKKIVEACANGGAKVIEFTNRGDFAYEVFAKLTQWCNENVPDAILGVGTVIDQGTAALYINSGANFVVGPILNIEIAKLCNRRKIAYSPGCGSVTEISQAEELGAEIVKIFPGEEVGGPGFVKNSLVRVRGPRLCQLAVWTQPGRAYQFGLRVGSRASEWVPSSSQKNLLLPKTSTASRGRLKNVFGGLRKPGAYHSS